MSKERREKRGENIVFAGQYSPDFTRNRKILNLLESMGQEVVQCRADHASWFRRQMQLHRLLLACRNPKLIVAGYPSYSSAVTLWLAAKQLHAPLVLDAFIPYFETKVEDRQIVSRWHPKAWAIWLMEFVAYKGADIILTDTESHAKFIAKSFWVPKGKLAIVRAHPTVERRSETDESGENFVEGVHGVTYIGNFVPLHGVDVIVRAANLLERQRPDIAFCLAGRGQTHSSAKRLAEELGVTNIAWIDSLTTGEARQLLSDSVICLGIFGRSKKASRVVPHKLLDGLLVGVPVISRTSEACRDMEAAGAMVGVIPDDAIELAHQIKMLVDDACKQRSLARAGARLLDELHSDDALVQQLSNALRL